MVNPIDRFVAAPATGRLDSATTGVVSHNHPSRSVLAVPPTPANRSKATDQTYQQVQAGLRRSTRTRRAPAVTTASETGELCQLTGVPTYHPASMEDYIMDGGPLLRQLNADPFVNEGEWEGCNRKRPMSTEQRLQHRKAVVQVLSQATADIERDAIADVEQAPANYTAAAKDPLWVTSMEKEMAGLMKNGTYEPVLDTGQPTVRLTWAYRAKTDERGLLQKRKSRCCIQGFSQRFGISFGETYSATPYWPEIRLFLTIAVNKGWKIFQYDVEQAFLTDPTDMEMFVQPCKGFDGEEHKPDHLKGKPVCWRVLKNWYGAKQGPRIFSLSFAKHLQSVAGGAWAQSRTSPCLFVWRGDRGFECKSDPAAAEFLNAQREHVVLKDPNGKILPNTLADGTPVEVYLVHWVDDLLVMSNSDAHRLALIECIKRRYKLEDMGLAKWFLGMELVQTDGCIELLQTAYIERFCKDLFGITKEDQAAAPTPWDPNVKLTIADIPESEAERAKLRSKFPMREACGKFIYLRHTKPECAYAISQVCRYAANPTANAVKQARRIAQHAFNNRHRGLRFTRCTNLADLMQLRAFADASFLDCPDTARSTGGFCVFFCGCLLSFESKRLPLVTMSTAESEFVEASRCATEVEYLRELLLDFGISVEKVPIMEDNTACVQISKNPIHHQRTKHVAKYYMYLRDLCLAGEIELVGCGTKVQVADVFTKGLDRTQFQKFRDVLTGYRTYSDLLSADCETINQLRMVQQWNADEEIKYLETSSEYSYRL